MTQNELGMKRFALMRQIDGTLKLTGSKRHATGTNISLNLVLELQLVTGQERTRTCDHSRRMRCGLCYLWHR